MRFRQQRRVERKPLTTNALLQMTLFDNATMFSDMIFVSVVRCSRLQARFAVGKTVYLQDTLVKSSHQSIRETLHMNSVNKKEAVVSSALMIRLAPIHIFDQHSPLLCCTARALLMCTQPKSKPSKAVPSHWLQYPKINK